MAVVVFYSTIIYISDARCNMVSFFFFFNL